jgi:hypothetical protein
VDGLRWYVMVDGGELYVACLNSYEDIGEYRGVPLIAVAFETEGTAKSVLKGIYEYVGRLQTYGRRADAGGGGG